MMKCMHTLCNISFYLLLCSSTRDNLLLFFLQDIELSVPSEAIMDMAISFNNKYLALFTESGIVWIGSADLKVID